MEGKIVLADTSILIDYFRKTDKSKSILFKLFREGNDFCISAITEYEIYCGANAAQLNFWDNMLKNTKVVAFDHLVVKTAVEINNILKRKRNQIDLADLFIASTSIAHNLPFATLNKRHFERINGLQIIE